MLEGVSIRAIARLTTIVRNTILSILPTAGGERRSLLAAHIRRVQVRYLPLDEAWAFVHTKEEHLAERGREEWGDAYRWVGLHSETELIISHLVGKRDGACANEFVQDLSDRILGRCQATSDGFKPYSDAVAEAWGADMDIAQLTNVYLHGVV